LTIDTPPACRGVIHYRFHYRFHRSRGLAGHSLGNLLILALEKITGSFAQAITEASKILAIKGQVVPSTFTDVQLAGKLANGKTVVGERKLFLAGMKSKIISVWLVPEKVHANPKAISAINSANIIIIGPGSFYTSIIPNLLIGEITQAIIANKKAKKIYICNVSTERGETQNFSVKDHIAMLQQYGGDKIARYCLVNNKIISKSAKQYKLGEVHNISCPQKSINGVKIIKSDIINIENPLYHDSVKLSQALNKIIYEK